MKTGRKISIGCLDKTGLSRQSSETRKPRSSAQGSNLDNNPTDFRFLTSRLSVFVGSEDLAAAVVASLKFEPRRVVGTPVDLSDLNLVDLKVKTNSFRRSMKAQLYVSTY